MDFRLAYAHRRSPLRVSLNYVKIVYFKCRLRLRPLFFFFLHQIQPILTIYCLWFINGIKLSSISIYLFQKQHPNIKNNITRSRQCCEIYRRCYVLSHSASGRQACRVDLITKGCRVVWTDSWSFIHVKFITLFVIVNFG